MFEEDFVLLDLAHASGRIPELAASRSGDVRAKPRRRRTPPGGPETLADEEKLHRALVLGLRDYVHKCGFKTVVLG